MLHYAVRDNNINKVRTLLRGKTDVNARYRNGDPLLYYAVMKGYIDIVKLLLEHGADANAHDRFINWGPLHIAAQSGNIEIVKLLLEHGADVHDSAGNGDTPLHNAVISNKIETAMLLLEHGARVNARNIWDRTPFHYSCNKTVEFLAARVIERYWLEAYWNPDYRVCQNRLQRLFAKYRAEADAAAPAH